MYETLIKNAFLNCVIIVQRNVFETSSYISVYNRICTIDFCVDKFCDSSDLCKNFLAVENVFKFRIHKLNHLQTITICNYGLN